MKDAYRRAYEILEQQNIGDTIITCSKCGGDLMISPIVKNAYYKKNGILHFETDTMNYCKNCSK